MKIRVFISSVQKELADERRAVADFIRKDPLLCRFFTVFLFEELPASNCRADSVYLSEVDRSAVYVALLGNEYGTLDKEGFSPTHRQFLRATELKKHRLIFVKGSDDTARDSKMRALVGICSTQLVRRRFSTIAELIGGVYASLVDYLAEEKLLRFSPFDAAVCPDTGLKDISKTNVMGFLNLARSSRGLPLEAKTDVETLLSHLRLLKKGKPTNAAILLFGKEPQRFIYSSEVKCAHFHGIMVQKPIPFYQVYKGNLFELVDQSVNFVLSKIDRAVGTRAQSVQAPVEYEIPPEAIREAIVNAIAHRDYNSTASVQVMLFSDRLEVWNPGTLPPALTLESLLKPHGSYPRNPLIAEPLYLAKYIERMGTGIGDMVDQCRNAGLPDPEFRLTDGFITILHRKPGIAFESVGGVNPQIGTSLGLSWDQVGTKTGLSPEEVMSTLSFCSTAKAIQDIQKEFKWSNRTKFRNRFINPLLREGLLEMTIPDKPNSRLQKYRLTANGKKLYEQLKK